MRKPGWNGRGMLDSFGKFIRWTDEGVEFDMPISRIGYDPWLTWVGLYHMGVWKQNSVRFEVTTTS